MVIEKSEDVKIGQWYTMCCHKDLDMIKTQQEIQEVKGMIGEYDTLEIWETEKEALLSIREMWDSKDEIKEIDDRLERIE